MPGVFVLNLLVHITDVREGKYTLGWDEYFSNTLALIRTAPRLDFLPLPTDILWIVDVMTYRINHSFYK